MKKCCLQTSKSSSFPEKPLSTSAQCSHEQPVQYLLKWLQVSERSSSVQLDHTLLFHYCLSMFVYEISCFIQSTHMTDLLFSVFLCSIVLLFFFLEEGAASWSDQISTNVVFVSFIQWKIKLKVNGHKEMIHYILLTAFILSNFFY